MADKVFINGVRFFPKRDSAPEFVLGTLVLTPKQISEWAAANAQYMSDYNGDSQVRIQITKGQEGKLVFAVDTWKPDGQKTAAYAPAATKKEDTSDLPF